MFKSSPVGSTRSTSGVVFELCFPMARSRTSYYFIVGSKSNGCNHFLDDVSRMVMVSGLFCYIAQMCAVAGGVTLFRTPYSPIIGQVTTIHAKRAVIVLRISDADTEKI